jgi:hypothetical protein
MSETIRRHIHNYYLGQGITALIMAGSMEVDSQQGCAFLLSATSRPDRITLVAWQPAATTASLQEAERTKYQANHNSPFTARVQNSSYTPSFDAI